MQEEQEQEISLTEVPGGLKFRKRVRMIALVVLGLCTCSLMVGIGLLSVGISLALGILSLVLAAALLLLGIYLNAASRLIRYTNGSTQWEWELKK
ncbi:MAG TPA: hypothetical protein VKT82_22750 [Ktedonobacterales bacterium]|nr:hypothetical protein [Ktedonobacterales bacterium]